MKTAEDEEIARVISFWGEAGPERWVTPDPTFDAGFREREHYLQTHERSLAQFPRNAFRGTGHMYATDGLAQAYGRAALGAGHDAAIAMPLRLFLYQPFAHSEEAAD